MRAVTHATSASDGKLPLAERKILTALAQYPAGRTKQQVAILTGYAVTGGGFNNALSRLRTLELIAGRGELHASGDFFQETGARQFG